MTSPGGRSHAAIVAPQMYCVSNSGYMHPAYELPVPYQAPFLYNLAAHYPASGEGKVSAPMLAAGLGFAAPGEHTKMPTAGYWVASGGDVYTAPLLAMTPMLAGEGNTTQGHPGQAPIPQGTDSQSAKHSSDHLFVPNGDGHTEVLTPEHPIVPDGGEHTMTLTGPSGGSCLGWLSPWWPFGDAEDEDIDISDVRRAVKKSEKKMEKMREFVQDREKEIEQVLEEFAQSQKQETKAEHDMISSRLGVLSQNFRDIKKAEEDVNRKVGQIVDLTISANDEHKHISGCLKQLGDGQNIIQETAMSMFKKEEETQKKNLDKIMGSVMSLASVEISKVHMSYVPDQNKSFQIVVESGPTTKPVVSFFSVFPQVDTKQIHPRLDSQGNIRIKIVVEENKEFAIELRGLLSTMKKKQLVSVGRKQVKIYTGPLQPVLDYGLEEEADSIGDRVGDVVLANFQTYIRVVPALTPGDADVGRHPVVFYLERKVGWFEKTFGSNKDKAFFY